jgi:hypothetical protein
MWQMRSRILWYYIRPVFCEQWSELGDLFGARPSSCPGTKKRDDDSYISHVASPPGYAFHRNTTGRCVASGVAAMPPHLVGIILIEEHIPGYYLNSFTVHDKHHRETGSEEE